MLIPFHYSDNPDGPKALVTLFRVHGQRWHHLACFGRKSHYYEDGGCEHTDAVFNSLNDHYRPVTKLLPFGNGECVPKRPRKREAA